VDASFVEVPRQRNTREENAKIKEGQIPEEWKADPAKLRQKDTDARWTKKNEVTFFGYKDHVTVDVNSKLISSYEVSDASVHDSQVLTPLLDKKDADTELCADSAYRSEEIEKKLKRLKAINRIHEKANRNRPLSKSQWSASCEGKHRADQFGVQHRTLCVPSRGVVCPERQIEGRKARKRDSQGEYGSQKKKKHPWRIY
jgi:transposase, IS5 family